jgi:hypothetical protein
MDSRIESTRKDERSTRESWCGTGGLSLTAQRSMGGFYQDEYSINSSVSLSTEAQAACNANDLGSRRHVAIRKRAGGAIPTTWLSQV